MSVALNYSRNMLEARQSVARLYRAACKAAPTICRTYRLQYTPADLRKKFRFQIEQNRSLTDPQMVDLLVMKGANDLEETLDVFKTKSHVMYYLEEINENPTDPRNLTMSEFTEEEREILGPFLNEDPKGWDSFEKFS